MAVGRYTTGLSIQQFLWFKPTKYALLELQVMLIHRLKNLLALEQCNYSGYTVL